MAGIRTFPLITVLGTLTALLADHFGGWVLAAGLVALALMILVGNLAKLNSGRADAGLTSEIAMLLMFTVGATMVAGYTAAAVAVGGGVAVLLHWKEPLHDFVRRMGEADLKATIRLVLIGLVILPVLPNRAFGPYDVLNPFEIWLMVVLIVGISLGAYVTYKLVGAGVGTLVAGLLGGMISSTATTVSYARRARTDPDCVPMAAVVIAISSTVVFVRVLIEIAIVAPSSISAMAPPLLVMMGFMTLLVGGLFVASRGHGSGPAGEEAPSEMKAAIVFGLLYAVIIFSVAAAKEHFGASGMFVVAGLSGLTDMDAITLSTAQLIRADRLDVPTGWRLILVAIMANLVLKGAAVAFLGNRRLFARVAVVFALAFGAGVGLLMLWPG